MSNCKERTSNYFRPILYLAAAVSDFYLPEEDIKTHKIQSHPHEPLTITLKPVEKVLTKLVKNWCPNAFVVSFKVIPKQNIFDALIFNLAGNRSGLITSEI